MKLPFNIEPQIERAKLIYPKVLQLILDFTNFCDDTEDKDNKIYAETNRSICFNKIESIYTSNSGYTNLTSSQFRQ